MLIFAKNERWFNKIETRSKNKVAEKILALNLVELTILYGAESLSAQNEEKIKNISHLAKSEVVTHNIIISSLGIVPKDAHKNVKRVNIICKRMAAVVFKRSYKIYIKTFEMNCRFNDIFKAHIKDADSPLDMQEKHLNMFQDEISSHE
jgi:hypothetical protein